MTILRMRIALTICNTDFPPQQRFQKHSTTSRYTYIACLVLITSFFLYFDSSTTNEARTITISTHVVVALNVKQNVVKPHSRNANITNTTSLTVITSTISDHLLTLNQKTSYFFHL